MYMKCKSIEVINDTASDRLFIQPPLILAPY